MKNLKRTLILTAGGLLTAIGSFLTIGGIGVIQDSLESEKNISGDVAALLFLGVLPALFGVWVIYNQRKRDKKQQIEVIERQILMLARAKGGRITPSELASQTQLSLHQALESLNKMQENGFAHLHTSKRGAIVFEFPEFLSPDERDSLESLL